MSFVPGLGIAKGMALTLRRFFAPKATIQYPETTPDIAVRFRGRLQLLYDEFGNLKCETCFQCAQACPVECIDMGGHDTKGRFWNHWGPAETYGERREESALRRSGLPVPDDVGARFEPIDMAMVERILSYHDFDPAEMLPMLEGVQGAYGYLPVAALKRISQVSGAPYALIYGLATSYRHLSFARPSIRVAVCRCTSCLVAGSGRIAATLSEILGPSTTGAAPGPAVAPRRAPGGAAGASAMPGGAPAFETLTVHVPGAPSPLVTLDGKPQSVTEAGAAAWGRSLAGKGVA